MFENCDALEEVTIASSIKEIYKYAFSGCLNIKSITCFGVRTKPIAARTSSFSTEAYNNAYVYIPKGMLEIYKSSSVWKKFQHLIEVDMEDGINSLDSTTPFEGQIHYNLNGQRIRPNNRGVHIMRTEHGYTRKVLIP